MYRRLQPSGMEAVTLCNRGCIRYWRQVTVIRGLEAAPRGETTEVLGKY